MRNVMTLTRVLLKEMGASWQMQAGMSGKKNRPLAGPLLMGVLAVCMLPLAFLFYNVFQGLCAVFIPAGQLAYVTGLILNIAGVVVLFFSLISVPAVFYFAKDVEYLLPLPLRPWQIIAAKFLTALFIEYGVALMVMAPMCAAYAQYLPLGPLAATSLVTFLILPVLPLIYAIVLVMLLMRVFRFGRNRDFYNMAVSLIAIVIGAGSGMFVNQLNTLSQEQMIALVTGDGAALSTLRSVFPSNGFAGAAVANGDFLSLLIAAAIAAGAVALFLWLAERVYFRGVIGVTETASSGRRMTGEQVRAGARARGVFGSYLIKEFRTLLRSPTALVNCVLMVYLLPVIMIISVSSSLSAGDSGLQLSGLLGMIDFNDPGQAAMTLVVAAGAGIMMGAMNLVTVTAISREGSNAVFMNYIPVPYRTQIHAKAACGLLISLSGAALLSAAAQIVLRMPVLLFSGALALLIPSMVMMNYLGLLIDLFKPKLVWDSEQMAVKNNMNALIMSLGGMVLAAAVVVPGLFLFRSPTVTFAVLFAALIFLAAAIGRVTVGYGKKRLPRLDV